MFIFHLTWVGLSIAKYAVWVVPLALCCQNSCGGQHVINELQLKFQSLGLFDQVVIPRWLRPSYFPVEPASKLLYANYIHRYCTFHNMLTIICTRCFFSTLSVPNHVDDNTHIPCLLNTTLPVSLCIWNLEGHVSCIVFLAENSPSVLIFNVDSQPLASSLLSRNCLTLVIMKSIEVNGNCIFAPVLYKPTLLKLMKTKVPTDPVVPSTNWCQCRVILTSRWHRPCESTPWWYISYIHVHAWHFLGFKGLCLWCPSSSPSDCWILTHILPVSSLSESKNFPKNLTVLLIFWDWWNNLVSYFELLSCKFFL